MASQDHSKTDESSFSHHEDRGQHQSKSGRGLENENDSACQSDCDKCQVQIKVYLSEVPDHIGKKAQRVSDHKAYPGKICSKTDLTGIPTRH